jgi:NitT/TauT family transport system substrate-binding protein
MRKDLGLAVLLGALVASGGSAAPPDTPPVKVRLALHWVHQAQFAGYYLAIEDGFYRSRGLDVEILRGGPDRDTAQLLGTGQAEVGTFFLAGAMKARSEGLPLVHLAQVVNRSNLVVIGWKDAGIRALEHLDGRRMSLWLGLFDAQYRAFFGAVGVNPRIVPQYGSVSLFLNRGVDACSAMEYNEVHRIYQAGVDPSEVTVLRLRDRGFGLPEDGLYCLEERFRANPAAYRAFAEASLQGRQAVKADPERALRVVMRYTRGSHVPTNQAHMRWMLVTILAAIFPGPGDPWTLGELGAEEYERAAGLLLSQGLVTEVPGYGRFIAGGGVHVP